MIFTPYDFSKIEEYTQNYKTILYSEPNKTLYKIKDNIEDINTHIKNEIDSSFIVIYSERIFKDNDNTDNIKKIIKSKENSIQEHMKANFIKCFKVDTNIINNIQQEKTQNHIISNLDRYLTIYNKVKLNIEKVFKDAIEKTHYAGAVQNSDKTKNKKRVKFENNLTSKNGVKLILELVKGNLDVSSIQSPNRLLYHETIAFFMKYLSKFLNDLQTAIPQKLTSTKLLREQKLNVITFIVNEFLKSNLQINNCHLSDAQNKFKYIFRKIKFTDIIYTPEISTLTIEKTKIINSVDEIVIIPKIKEPSDFFKPKEIEYSF
jgi:hypothetical protein